MINEDDYFRNIFVHYSQFEGCDIECSQAFMNRFIDWKNEWFSSSAILDSRNNVVSDDTPDRYYYMGKELSFHVNPDIEDADYHKLKNS